MDKENLFKKNGKALVSKVIASSDIKKAVKSGIDLIGGFEKAISAEIK